MRANKKFKEAYFDYIGSITLSTEVVDLCNHQGDCENDILECMELPEIKAELKDIDPDQLRKELKDFDKKGEMFYDRIKDITWENIANNTLKIYKNSLE